MINYRFSWQNYEAMTRKWQKEGERLCFEQTGRFLQKKMANSPLRPPTLASIKTWGIQQELVICRCKDGRFYVLVKIFRKIVR